MTGEEREAFFKVAFLLLMILDHAGPEGTGFPVAFLMGDQNGERCLAVPEIIPDILAHFSGNTAIIEAIINKLESHTKRIAIIAQRRDLRLINTGHHTANLGSSSKQRRCLAAHDLEIAFLATGKIMLRRKLQNLAFRNHGGGIGQNVEHTNAARLHHQREGPREEIITDQYALLIAEKNIRRRPPAPFRAFINDIIM